MPSQSVQTDSSGWCCLLRGSDRFCRSGAIRQIPLGGAVFCEGQINSAGWCHPGVGLRCQTGAVPSRSRQVLLGGVVLWEGQTNSSGWCRPLGGAGGWSDRFFCWLPSCGSPDRFCLTVLSRRGSDRFLWAVLSWLQE